MKNRSNQFSQLLRIPRNVMPGIVSGAIIGIVVVIAQANLSPTSALSLSSPRDCDSNAVINCGALTTTELKQRYSQSGVANIYSYFGITSADISVVDRTAVAGHVYKNGNVVVGGKIVATNAITAGRQNISGSKEVSQNGTRFYTRPPSVSFRSVHLTAFVVMKDGVFKYAILAACGNPVKATPVPKPITPAPAPQPAPTPTPAPQPSPTPTPTPTPTPPTVTPVVSTQTPVSTPTAPVAETAPATLPSVGPAHFLIVLAFAIGGGYIFHMTHRHVRHTRRSR